MITRDNLLTHAHQGLDIDDAFIPISPKAIILSLNPLSPGIVVDIQNGGKGMNGGRVWCYHYNYGIMHGDWVINASLLSCESMENTFPDIQ